MYKLLIFYEEIEILGTLFEKEISDKTKRQIISECFSYALLVNNPILAVFLRNNYIDYMLDHTSTIIDSILHYINEFSENNGSSKYLKRMKNFECYLYLLEVMINYISYTQAKYFIQIVSKLIRYLYSIFSYIYRIGSPHSEKQAETYKKQSIIKFGKENIIQNYRNNMITNKEKFIDTFQDNFIVYCTNPVKICIQVLHILKLLEKKHHGI